MDEDENEDERFDTSRLRRDRYRRKLDKGLAGAPDEAFFQQVWATDALQAGRPDVAGRYLTFPHEALTAGLGDEGHIFGWSLESLINERLRLPVFAPQPDQRRVQVTRTDSFEVLAWLAACLNQLENAESGIVLKRLDVLREMPRLLHRQFEYQRGFQNGPQLYRWAFLYGGPLCTAHFKAKTGLTMADLIKAGYLIRHRFTLGPVWSPEVLRRAAGPDVHAGDAVLRLLSRPLAEARKGARAQHAPRAGVAYQASQLRRSPIIAFGPKGDRLRAPIPDLILARITSGVFYDLVDAPSGARNEAGKRFELYVADLLNAHLPAFKAGPGQGYRFRNGPIDGADVLLENGDAALVAVFECKARKMSLATRYAEDRAAETGVDELVKGVFQIWRFFAHHRLGLVPGPAPDASTVGVLVTLDNWMTMSADLQRSVLDRARTMAWEKAVGIETCDQRPVVFCSIDDLESTLQRADEPLFVADLQRATEERFTGWMLPNVHRDIDTGIRKPFPLAHRLHEVLPWMPPRPPQGASS